MCKLILFKFFRFDFDGDDLISQEDVQILLSYIPFKNQEELKNGWIQSNKPVSSMSSQNDQQPVTCSPEGLYKTGGFNSMNKE